MAMALCFGCGIVEVLERIGHIMDFMKPDLTTVHKEEPLLEIRLCSQHVSALLGWTAQYTCRERTCLGGRWNHWRLNKCIWPAPGWVGVLAPSWRIQRVYTFGNPPPYKGVMPSGGQTGRESLWTIIRMYHSIKELLSYSCNSFMY